MRFRHPIAAPLKLSGIPRSDFSIKVSRIPRVVLPISSSIVTIDDRRYTRYVPGQTRYDAKVQVTADRSLPAGDAFSFESSDESVASVDADGFVTHLADGMAIIRVRYGGIVKEANLRFTTSADGTNSDVFLDFAAGTLGANASTAIDSRIAGKTPSAATPVFSSQNHGAGVYVRNTGCWAADIDLTPVSPWNSDGGANKAGIAISPRHVLFARHYQMAVGTVIRFVTTGNVTVERTITAKANISTLPGYYPDITIGLLDSDLPATISFAKFLPASFASRITQRGEYIPAIAFDQEEKALVTEVWLLGTDSGDQWAVFRGQTTPQRFAFFEVDVGGDSGNPICLIVDGQLVLTTVMTFYGAGHGTFVTGWLNEINATMTSLGGGYQVTEIDLSAYPTFS